MMAVAQGSACLPMYDIAELRTATDAWWGGLARHLREAGVEDAPDLLDRTADPQVLWRSPDLVVAQCCGYDLRLGEAPAPSLLATPVYDVQGCDGPSYCSFLVVREEERAESLAGLRGRRAAVNMRGSHSGHNVLRFLLAEEGGAVPFFSHVVESGGHRASLAAVRTGEADLAAIDCVTFTLVSRSAPEEVKGLRILMETPKAPGLPYITAPGASGDRTRRLLAGLKSAMEDPALAALRAALRLRGFALLLLEAYDPIVAMARSADSLGYPNLL